MRKYLWSLFSISIGSAVTLTGSYICSRLKEKRDLEIRLERLEQIVEELEKKEENRKLQKN